MHHVMRHVIHHVMHTNMHLVIHHVIHHGLCTCICKTTLKNKLLSENVLSYMAVSLYIQSTLINDLIRGFSSKVGFQFDFTRYRAAIKIKILLQWWDYYILHVHNMYNELYSSRLRISILRAKEEWYTIPHEEHYMIPRAKKNNKTKLVLNLPSSG